MGHEVIVHLYDLSQGMARQMSMQFLGKQIDLIPHTGVVVYGHEYFFGGGIAVELPGRTMAGVPHQTFYMGETQIEQGVFHDWLKSVSHRFTQDTYDLLKHNCNNFSDAVTEFLVGRPIPSFITGLPDEALNSPMGMMFRPMIENMQAQMRQNPVGGGLPTGQLSLPMVVHGPNSSSKYQGQITNYHVSREEGKAKTKKKEVKSIDKNSYYQIIEKNSSSTTPSQSMTEDEKAAFGPTSGHIHRSIALSALTLSTQPQTNAVTRAVSAAKCKALITKVAALCIPVMELSEEDMKSLDILVEVTEGSTDATLTKASIELLGAMIVQFPTDKLTAIFGLLRMLSLKESLQEYVAAKVQDADSKLLDRLLAPLTNTDSKLNVNSQLMLQILSLNAVSNFFSNSNLGTILSSHPSISRAVAIALRHSDSNVRCMGGGLALNISLFLSKDEEASSFDIGYELVSVLLEALEKETDVVACVDILIALAHLCFCNSALCLMVHEVHGFSSKPYKEKFILQAPDRKAEVVQRVGKLLDDLDKMIQVAS